MRNSINFSIDDTPYKVRYFVNSKARKKAKQGMTNGYTRNKELTNRAMKLSEQYNANQPNPFNHYFVVRYENTNRAAVVTVSADGKTTETTYVGIDELSEKMTELEGQNYHNLFKALNTENMVHLIHKQEQRKKTSHFCSLKKNQYILNLRIGYVMVSWRDSKSQYHCQYFESEDYAREFIKSNLKEFEEIKK